MSTHKHFDKICCVVLTITLLITILFMNAEKLEIQSTDTAMGYENKLFDTSTVHTVNIIMDDWDEFIDTCTTEEYSACTVVIDNEAYKNVAIRAKGNTSLTQVASYGNNRYSFKIEFDHYDSSSTYHGLDKLCLNNIIQDNTYMKDYLCYQMMAEMGVASPLCSYVYITVNDEDWGLYLAVEGIEESFLQRNYGNNYGELYKPDSQSMGGGRGNGKDFNVDDFMAEFDEDLNIEDFNAEEFNTKEFNSENFSDNMPDMNGAFDDTMDGDMPDMNGAFGDMMDGNMPDMNGAFGDTMDGDMPDMNGAFGDTMDGDMPDMNGAFGDTTDGNMPDMNETFGDVADNTMGGMMNSSDDVLLKYIDDNYDSYSNIFNNAKTEISDSDKDRLIESLQKLSANEDLENTVDIDSVIRYFVVHNFVLNFDSYTGSMIHNYYLYEEDSQMQMIPWDYNLAFGGFQSSGNATSLVNYPIDNPVSGGSIENRPMLAWIFSNEEYTELYHQYFTEFISIYFDSGYFETMIDNVQDMISPYVEMDPTKFCTYEEFETGIATLKEFCLLRAESITGQLDGTIGSTSDTQTADTLIDASEIQISDMGTMNQTMGGGMKLPTENNDSSLQDNTMQMPSENNNTPSQDSRMQMPSENNDNFSQGDRMQMPSKNNGDFSQGDRMQMPSENNDDFSQGDRMQMSSASNSSSTSSLIIAGSSVLVLIAGLIFALFFKRRSY